MTDAAASISAGLLPARDARSIRQGERIHVVGAAGAGASAAALLAQRAGAVPSGCDPGGSSPYTPPLVSAGIRLDWSHDPAHVTMPPQPDRLAVTKALTAVAPDHPELAAAREAGIPLEAWQQVVADAAFGHTLVGVAGTHGKSTTAGWLVHVLVAARVDPGAFVGALLPAEITGGLPGTARWGRGDLFVVEADEYAGNFDAFRPSVAVLTSVEWDHPDVFRDRSAVVDAFEAWIRRMPPAAPLGNPVLVANVGDEGVRDVVARLADWEGRIVRTAVVDAATDSIGSVTARIVARSPSGTRIEIRGLGERDDPAEMILPTAGPHNVANALGVAAAASTLGIGSSDVVTGLASFGGVGRRLERKGESGGVAVYDDYGHHPTAIRATLEAVRQREPGRRVWAVYEPLTYHRTAAFLDDFADALAGADGVAIADIWAGRDRDTSVATAQGLADAIASRRPDLPLGAPGSPESTAEWLAREVRPGDAVLVMGGGRSYRIGERLLEILDGR